VRPGFRPRTTVSNRPPIKCPSCGKEQVKIIQSSLIDGIDKGGRPLGGCYDIGTCNSCGAHSYHYIAAGWDVMEDGYRCGILTDEEFRQRIAFRSGGENDLA
jgi:hypothetical protein